MKTIIAPTDFSTVSLNAVNYAADMALALNAELVITHVADFSLIASDIPLMPTLNYDEEWGAEQLGNLHKKIIERTNNKINVRLENLKGQVFHELEELCNREQPFVLVMATHGAPAFERMFLPSVTLYAAKHISYPVLVVPANATYKGIKNIGLACDLKTIYEEPLQPLSDLISAFHSSLHVLHIKLPGEDEHYAEMMLTRHYLKEFKPVLHFIQGGNIAEGIFSFVIKNSIDILILIPRKHDLFEKSEFKKLILHPEIPLMALQPEL
jgi:nucleotide-binding universal stress UspA family protein